MSAHVILNLLNELGKRDKMRGLPSILSFFRNELKTNNTGARMLDSMYHMTLRLLCYLISALKRYNFVILYSKFSFGKVYRRIYGRKFSFTATRERSRKT